MNISITINTDNAAFQENMTAEVLEILRRLSLKIGRDEITISPHETSKIYDTNGNAVGKFEVS